MAHWLLMCGSPRLRGASAAALAQTRTALEEHFPQDSFTELNVVDLAIRGCTGCDHCQGAGACCIDDDMARVNDALQAADYLVVAAPIYFAGLPSQFKAVLDRLQPHFWQRLEQRREGGPLPVKRPAFGLLVGEGDNPYGCRGAKDSLRSALALADFKFNVLRFRRTDHGRVKQSVLGKFIAAVIADVEAGTCSDRHANGQPVPDAPAPLSVALDAKGEQ